MQQIKFSIGIPAFKYRYLKACIDSVLGQTYQNFELIIVDDCSPEPLHEIIEQFNDPRVMSFRNEINVGAENVVNNWNRCLEKATGDFFVLMGDDDKLEPDFLEEFARLIAVYPDLDVYHCRTRIIDENSEPIRLTPSCPEFESVYDNIWHRINGYRIQFISDFMYRVTVLKARGGYFFLPLAWASDDISAFIGCGVKGIAHTNKPVFNYRMNRYNISSTGNRELKMKAIQMQKEWFDQFLTIKPAGRDDLIIYNDLSGGIKRFIQKKKILTIARSLNKSTFRNILRWYKLRKKYDFSTVELMYAIVESVKTKKANSIY